MKINNSGEFFQFVKANSLTNITSEVVLLVQCMTEYGRMCNCNSVDSRNSKLNQCRNLYIAFVKQSTNHKNLLFSKTSDPSITFCVDNQILVTLNR